ncbi:hypothetical protein GOP47_0018169 [Adiantum capillus-veneris]|uniref:KAT8 regulatory NSL complex subunit 2 n=1 Tax=Adiantum capillus-veneris TaxID=13818 RepID=A0A9D4UGT6_ADICA|nr:hypothetical protein GOP47_0018169 [Adiantum capillus-veneris]
MGTLGSIGRTNKRLASLATFTSPLVTTTQGEGLGQQQTCRKSAQSPAVTGDPSPLHVNGDLGPMANFPEADPRRDAEMGSDNDSEVCDLALDGALEDEALKNADALTEQEVARRRLRRVNQLMRLYRMHYWGLLEELRSKYRVFYIKHGKGGWKDDTEAVEKEKLEGTVDNSDGQDFMSKGKLQLGDNSGAMKEPLAPDKSVGETLRCTYQGCKSKPLALSGFCFSHILSEPRQQLYRPCSFVIKSGQGGPVTCGKPVLRSLVPAHCAAHIQKQSSRSVRKANTNAAPKAGPKLHLVIAEYVRLIQCKRRAARDASLKNVAITNLNKDTDNAASSGMQ